MSKKILYIIIVILIIAIIALYNKIDISKKTIIECDRIYDAYVGHGYELKAQQKREKELEILNKVNSKSKESVQSYMDYVKEHYPDKYKEYNESFERMQNIDLPVHESPLVKYQEENKIYNEWRFRTSD